MNLCKSQMKRGRKEWRREAEAERSRGEAIRSSQGTYLHVGSRVAQLGQLGQHAARVRQVRQSPATAAAVWLPRCWRRRHLTRTSEVHQPIQKTTRKGEAEARGTASTPTVQKAQAGSGSQDTGTTVPCLDDDCRLEHAFLPLAPAHVLRRR